MASIVEICNIALVRCGHDMISSLDDATKGARLCRLMYEPTRDAMLRGHLWNFAIRRAELAANSNTPVFGFTYEFPVPDDFLKLIELETYVEHRMETNAEGQRVILVDDDTLAIEYVAKIVDPNLMDAMFRQALALTLAAAICPALTENAKMTELLAEEAKQATALARTLDAQEGTPRDVGGDEWLNARI